jgi:class 3 adenylate cyclase
MTSSEERLAALTHAGVRPDIASALDAFISTGSDKELSRVNVMEFASQRGLPVTPVIDAFVHAAHLGILEMAWNIACPGCGGVLDQAVDLRSFTKSAYPCSLCATSYEPTLDELVEVTFTVSPAVRRVSAHNPDTLSYWDYFRFVYVGSAIVLPTEEEWEKLKSAFTLEEEVLSPGERIVLSLQLPQDFLILFEPITHSATFLDVKGSPSESRQDMTVTFTRGGAVHQTFTPHPGPMRLTLENKSDRRLLPGLFRANDALHELFARRRPFLTAKHLLTNQTFRTLFKTSTLDVNQRVKVTSLTVLFTDLKGSTALYERVGDLVAFDIVREHFRVLSDVVRAHDGAVVKTIGDALMATFPTPLSGMSAALAMHGAMAEFNRARAQDELLVKIGLHEGPALAVTLNERLDYFGQTVNVAARVQDLATADALFATESVIGNADVRRLLEDRQMTPSPRRAALKGIAEEVTVYEIPVR